MKKAVLVITSLLMFSGSTLAITVPKRITGQYQAEVPAFDFRDNGRTVHASSFVLSLILKEDYLLYKSGILEFQGTYLDVIENGDLIDVSVVISNDMSLAFDLGLSVNKNTGSIAIKGLKGIPEVTLMKYEIGIKKKD